MALISYLCIVKCLIPPLNINMTYKLKLGYSKYEERSKQATFLLQLYLLIVFYSLSLFHFGRKSFAPTGNRTRGCFLSQHLRLLGNTILSRIGTNTYFIPAYRYRYKLILALTHSPLSLSLSHFLS